MSERRAHPEPATEELFLQTAPEEHSIQFACILDKYMILTRDFRNVGDSTQPTKTKHFGLNRDMGLFSLRDASADRDRRVRDGSLRPMAPELVDDAHAR